MAEALLPLRTRGRDIVGSDGSRVRLFCVNWYGAHMEHMVANGLSRQPLAAFVQNISGMGFNCVRLTFSLELLLGNRTHVRDPQWSLAANPELQNLSPLEIFDATVSALTHEGLLVILNNHVSAALWCCGPDDGEGLWYTDRYSEERWLQGLAFAAARYRGDRRVVGFDLRNEIRQSGSVFPTWGVGGESTDWAAAAVRGGKRVLLESPDLLVIVSGINYGTYLCDVSRRPIHQSEPELVGHVVYTAHEYPWFNLSIRLRLIIDWHFTQVLIVWGVVLAGVAMMRVWFWSRRRWCGSRTHAGAGTAIVVHCRAGAAPAAPGAARAGGDRCCRRRCGPAGPCELINLSFFSLLTLVAVILCSQTLKWCSDLAFLVNLGCLFVAFVSGAFATLLWLRLAVLTALLLDARLFGDLTPGTDAGIVAGPSPVARELKAMVQVEDGGDISWATTRVDIAGPRGESPTAVEITGRAPRPASAAPRAGEEAQAPSGTSPASGRWQGRQRARWAAATMRSADCAATGALVALLGAVLFIRGRTGFYADFAAELDDRWGFLLHGKMSEAAPGVGFAPVWLGELGTFQDTVWWRFVMRYCEENGVDFAYWSINGETWPGHDEWYGILAEDEVTVRHPWKLEALQRLMVAA